MSELHQFVNSSYHIRSRSCTYDHNLMKTSHPVRSGIYKHESDRLVLRWVTTWESLLLYVFAFLHSVRSEVMRILEIAALDKIACDVARLASLMSHPTSTLFAPTVK